MTYPTVNWRKRSRRTQHKASPKQARLYVSPTCANVSQRTMRQYDVDRAIEQTLNTPRYTILPLRKATTP